jgi:hypothetical protein
MMMIIIIIIVIRPQADESPHAVCSTLRGMMLEACQPVPMTVHMSSTYTDWLVVGCGALLVSPCCRVVFDRHGIDWYSISFRRQSHPTRYASRIPTYMCTVRRSDSSLAEGGGVLEDSAGGDDYAHWLLFPNLPLWAGQKYNAVLRLVGHVARLEA